MAVEKPNPTRKYITSEELRRHNNPEDLWISIQGKVYDVTKWAHTHPGGAEPLLNLAGQDQDVTDAFIAYHPKSTWNLLEHLFTGFYVKDFEPSEVSKDFRKLHNEFLKMGLFENKGHVQMVNMVSVAAMLALVWCGVLWSERFVVHMGCGFLLGLLWIVAAYLGHDSGHYIVMRSVFWNCVTQILAGNCVTGISIAWWKWTHNAHHITCNSLDYDPDLQHVPVFAVSDRLFGSLRSVFYGRELTFDGVARFLIKYQHFSYYPVMIFGRINLFVQTFLLLFSRRNVPDRLKNIFGILVFWTWFPLLVSYQPNWGERIMFVLIAFAVTALQHVQFTLNHFSGDTYVGPPKGNDWFEKQTAGTIDISCSCYMDWLFGGLQFQLEHHLFPRLPRCQLRKVSPIIQALCKKHNLPYRSLSFWDANVSTLRTLRNAALQARDLTNPVPKNLVWEALNTHG